MLDRLAGDKKARPEKAPGAKRDARDIKKAFGKLGQQPSERMAGFLSLDLKARKAYVKLPERERQRVDRLIQAVKSPPGDTATLATASIEKLLTKKVFNPPKASKGAPEAENQVLAQLDARLGKPIDPELAEKGLDGGVLTQEIVTALAFPGWVYQGKGTATCVPASLETILAKTAPAEYVRVATGLMWDGQVTLRGGETLALSTAELGMDDGGRGAAHQLLQGSLLALGERLEGGTSGAEPIGRGRYARPAVYGEGEYAPGGTGEPAAPVTPGRGLTGKQASELFAQVVGDPAVPFRVTADNRKAAWKMVKEAVETYGSASVGVATVDAQGRRTFHEITITEIGQNAVVIADSGVGDSQKIPSKQLLADLTSVIVPASFIAGQSQRLDEKREAGPAWVGKMVGSLKAGGTSSESQDSTTGTPAWRRKV